jgi:hypothetical protein
MLLKILLLTFYIFATIILYKLIFTKLEHLEPYQKIHEYYAQTMRLLNPRYYIECFKAKAKDKAMDNN